jgi:hypothetical protein
MVSFARLLGIKRKKEFNPQDDNNPLGGLETAKAARGTFWNNVKTGVVGQSWHGKSRNPKKLGPKNPMKSRRRKRRPV